MKRLFLGAMILLASACTAVSLDSVETESDSSVSNPSTSDPSGSDLPASGLYAEKASWKPAVKSSDDNMYVKDIPWKEGEKVMLIRTDAEKTLDQWGRVELGLITDTCTVTDISGLKCTLVPDHPLVDGVYQAVYPVYDYVTYDTYHSSLGIHLSFVYEDNLGLDYEHQDIIISESFSYKEGEGFSIVMKHICALVDIDIYPPKTGNYRLLKVMSDLPAFAGKANYFVNREYNINEIADCWFNFATLRGNGTSLKEGELFHTSTAFLPVQYDGMPMRIYLSYADGTYYLSEPFLMPSLEFGVENKLVVNDFTEINEPMQGLWGDCYMDENHHPYDIQYWEDGIIK